MRLEQFERGGLIFPVLDSGPLSGEPVILLHGFPELASSMQAVAEGLVSAGYRVLLPELRGYVRSANPSSRFGYTTSKLIGDVTALADAAKLDWYHLVGHDWGGLLGWYAVGHEQTRIKSFTALAAPHPRAFLKAILHSRQIIYSWYMIFFQLPYLPELILLSDNAHVLRGSLTDRGLPTDFAARICDKFLADRKLLTGALNWYRAMPLEIVRTLSLGPSLVDTLYVYGAADAFSAGLASTETAKWAARRYESVGVENANHWLPETCPGKVVEIFVEFQKAKVLGA